MVIRVEKISPPITEIPIGLQISEPSPVLKASGSIPRMVVSAVINTGRRRDFPDMYNGIIQIVSPVAHQVNIIYQYNGIFYHNPYQHNQHPRPELD